MTATVSVLVPWRPDGRHRDAAWAWVRQQWTTRHPTWQLVIGRHDDGPWCKAVALADALTRATGDILILADADVWCAATTAAVEAVRCGAAWAVPHKSVNRLTAEATAQLLAGGPLRGPLERRHRGHPGGGLTVITRRLYEQAPLDPRFLGWGQEDDAAAVAWTSLSGTPWRGTVDLWHLWHPPAKRLNPTIGSPGSRALHLRYVRAARAGPHAVRALLAEAREDRHAARH